MHKQPHWAFSLGVGSRGIRNLDIAKINGYFGSGVYKKNRTLGHLRCVFCYEKEGLHFLFFIKLFLIFLRIESARRSSKADSFFIIYNEENRRKYVPRDPIIRIFYLSNLFHLFTFQVKYLGGN